MFRNPVYDMFVVVPALLIAGLLGLLIMTSPARAAEVPTSTSATTTGERAETASTSGSTLPDASQQVLIITRENAATAEDTTLSPLAIHSTDELVAYAKTVVKNDPYLASISLSGTEITVNYRKQGRLLGLVSVPLPTTAHVHTDGSVSFDEPWYNSLTFAEKDHMKTALEVRVHALLTSEGYLASMSLAPATQAEILDMIRDLLA